MQITKPNEQDANECVKLAYSALGTYAHSITLQQESKDVLNRLALFFNHDIKTPLHKSNFIIAKKDNKIIGLCTCYKGELTSTYNKNIVKLNTILGACENKLSEQAKLMEFTKEAENDEYYLDTIAVNKEYRGLGVAKMLLKEAIKEAKSKLYHKIAIVVEDSESKRPLIKMYEHLGFKVLKKVELCGINYHKMIINF